MNPVPFVSTWSRRVRATPGEADSEQYVRASNFVEYYGKSGWTRGDRDLTPAHWRLEGLRHAERVRLLDPWSIGQRFMNVCRWNIDDELYRQYLGGLLRSDEAHCHGIVTRLLDEGTEIATIYTDLLGRALHEIGELWESNRISVADEHIATAITEAVMTQVYPTLFARQSSGKSAVISCVANEYHQVGGKMVADILELRGWNTTFLGANTPFDDLLGAIEENRPDAVGLSLAVAFNFKALERAIEAVAGAFPGLPIWVGGQAFQWGHAGTLSRPSNVKVFQSLTDLNGLLAQGSCDDQ